MESNVIAKLEMIYSELGRTIDEIKKGRPAPDSDDEVIHNLIRTARTLLRTRPHKTAAQQTLARILRVGEAASAIGHLEELKSVESDFLDDLK